MASRLPLVPSQTDDGEGSSSFSDGLRSLAFNLNRLGSLASGLLLQHERQLVSTSRKLSDNKKKHNECLHCSDDSGGAGERRIKSALKHKASDVYGSLATSECCAFEAEKNEDDARGNSMLSASKQSTNKLSLNLPRTFTQAKLSGKKVSLPPDAVEVKGQREERLQSFTTQSMILPRTYESCKKLSSPPVKHVALHDSVECSEDKERSDAAGSDETPDKLHHRFPVSSTTSTTAITSSCGVNRASDISNSLSETDSIERNTRLKAAQRARMLAANLIDATKEAELAQQAIGVLEKKKTCDKQRNVQTLEEEDPAQVRRPLMLMLEKPGGSTDLILPASNGDLRKESVESGSRRDRMASDEWTTHSTSAKSQEFDAKNPLSRQDSGGSLGDGAAEIKLRDEWTDLPTQSSGALKMKSYKSGGLCRFNITVLDTPDYRVLTTTQGAANAQRLSRLTRNNSRLLPREMKFSILQAPLTLILDSSRRHHFLMHPLGWPKILWCFLCVILISYDVIMIPMQVFPLPKSGFFETMEWMCSIFWTLDVFINFRSGYFVGNKVEMNPKNIAIKYAKTWLTVDLGVVSLEWIGRFVDNDSSSTSDTGSIFKLSRFVRSLRVIRLLRLMKLPILFQLVEDQFHSPLFHLFFWLIKMTVGLMVVIHYITCGWYLIGDLSNPGWTDYSLTPPCGGDVRAEIAISREEELAARGSIIWYVDSARWVLSQVNGRTDMDTRRNLVEMCYTCVVAIAGPLICMSIFASLITSTMMELSEAAAGRKQMMLLLNQYLHANKVSAELTQLMKMHIRRKKEHEEGDHEEDVLKMLPKALQSDLIFEVRQPHIVEHHFFSILDRHYPRALRHVCIQSLQTLMVQPNDRVFEKGDSCSRMLFAYKGAFLYAKKEAKKKDFMKTMATQVDLGGDSVFPEDVTRSLAPNPYIGHEDTDGEREKDVAVGRGVRAVWICEAALWLEWHHLGRFSAYTSGALMSMELKTFLEALRNYTSAMPLVCNYASEFAEKVKQHVSANGKLSDIIDVKMVYNGHSIYRGNR